MSVWLTPDGKPFFGGTYFPPDTRYGRPGFRTILESLARPGVATPEDRVESSRRVVEQLGSIRHAAVLATRGAGSGTRWMRLSSLSRGRSTRAWADSARRPSFRVPACSISCLRYGARTHNDEALRDGPGDLARDGQGRHARSARRRISSLLGGRKLVRSAFRKDAVRPGAARDFVSGGVSDHRRCAVTRMSPATSSITCCAT